MRFIYSDRSFQEEQRENIFNMINDWWDEFSRRQSDIISLFKNEVEWDLAAWIQENLQKINQDLMWEFGPGIEKEYRLVITPESNTYLRPLVTEKATDLDENKPDTAEDCTKQD